MLSGEIALKNNHNYYYYIIFLGELLMSFQDAAFLPSRASFPPHFLKIVVGVNVLGPPHVLILWLWVSKGMLPVSFFHSNKASFCVS